MFWLHTWALGISMKALTTPGGASHSPIPVRPSWSVSLTTTVSTLPSPSRLVSPSGTMTGMTSTRSIREMVNRLRSLSRDPYFIPRDGLDFLT